MAKSIKILNLLDKIYDEISYYDDPDSELEIDMTIMNQYFRKIKDILNQNLVTKILNSPKRSLEYNHDLFISLIDDKQIDPKKYIDKFINYGTEYNICSILLKASSQTVQYFLSINKDILRENITTVIYTLCFAKGIAMKDPQYPELHIVMTSMIRLYGQEKNLPNNNNLSESLCILYNAGCKNINIYLMLINLGADINYRTKTSSFDFDRLSFLDRIKKNNFINIPFNSHGYIYTN